MINNRAKLNFFKVIAICTAPDHELPQHDLTHTYANNFQNVDFTSDEDSQIASRQLRYIFFFTYISYISITIFVITITNNMSHIEYVNYLTSGNFNLKVH